MKLYADIVITILLLFYVEAIIAQDIYGIGNEFGGLDRGIVKYSFHTGKDTLISNKVKHFGINQYEKHTTSDLQSRYFFVTGDDSSTLDTIISFDVLTKAVAKYPIGKNMMKHPEFHQNIIYGVCPFGFSCFDLNTKTLTICDTIIKDYVPGNEFDKHIVDKSFDHNREYYIFLKRGLAATFPQSDTLFRYHIRTKTLQKYPVPFTLGFEYSPKSDRAYLICAHYDRISPEKVLSSYDFNTDKLSILRYCYGQDFTIDPFKNRLYFKLYAARPNDDSLYQYRINSNKLDAIPVSSVWTTRYLEFLPTYNDTTTDSTVNILTAKTRVPNVYPTIVHEFVHIKNIDPASVIALSNVLGQTVLQEKVYATEFKCNVADLPAGLYILTITNTGQGTTYKLIKQ